MPFSMCIDLNSEAIDLLKEGRAVDSIRTIKMALCCLESYFANLPPPHLQERSTRTMESQPVGEAGLQEIDSNTEDANGSEDAPRHAVVSSSFHSVLVMSTVLNDVSPHNIFDFFPKMFQITNKNADEFGLSKVLVILLYNLAVSHHILTVFLPPLESNATFVHPRYRVEPVLQLYETALAVARTSLNREEVEGLLPPLLATTNNLGHGFSHLGYFQETSATISMMINLLALSTTMHPIHPEDYVCFFQSICIFLDGQNQNLCISPAA